ncbi:MAG: hypothetical protein OJF50_000357 [Nitrospira sp.]|jgi:hypothetical protein|uniref:Secreted protein n=1 Tax=Nitrospira moscoviensis TaxID=42253 RepID=A0A0K2GAP5_NITMO|nr:conserved exported protein of unknown function [Nitrospira moscoviensis]MDI3461536.1 hypothetical protein [Nitrospira sp.]
MPARSRTVLVWAMAACLLLLSGLAYPQMVPHAVHHAHHNAATHATVLCAWVCAAGHSIESVAFVFQSDYSPFSRFVLTSPHVQAKAPASSPTSRGPPFFSF